MSKEFEKEYRQMAAADVPDLWDRIEAGLSEKQPAAQSPVVDIHSETVQKRAGAKERAVSRKALQRTAAAAVVALLVLASGAALLRGNKQRAMQSTEMNSSGTEAADSVMMDGEAAQTMDEAWEKDAAPVPYNMSESSAANEAAEENAWNDTIEAEDWIDGQEQAMAGTEGESAPVAGAEAADRADSADAISEEQGNYLQAQEMEGILYRMTIQVTEIENTGEEIVYYGEVISSEEDSVSAGSTVSFCIGDETLMTPREGEICSVTLEDPRPYASDIHPYLLREIETAASNPTP